MNEISILLRVTLLFVGSFCAMNSVAQSPIAQSPIAQSPIDQSSFDQAAAVFAKHCLQCHNDVDREGEFSLQSKESLDESGFVDPADPSSHLLSVLRPDGIEPPSMPKDADPLSRAEVAAIQAWIESGAPWPQGETITEPVGDFDWWSFQPITRPSIPEIDSQWIRNPIDAFALQALAQNGLTHSRQADRPALIRRIYYDLIGLPPTPDEIDTFVESTDSRAYEKLVDRLLESDHYGERWARHWLDVVKYADTCGYDKDKLRPNAWPYRDYVIRSLNDDKPYSRFVQEQIAGDVLFPDDPDGILGLGFIAAGPWDFIGHVEVSEQKLDGKVARNLDRDEMVSNTLNTFCSVTIQCARCHNHKFDPFTQEHYYSLQGVFAAVDRADRVYQTDPHIETQRRRLETELASHQTTQQKLDAEIAAVGGEKLKNLDTQIEQLTEKAGLRKDSAFGFHSAMTDKFDAEKWVQIDLGNEVEAAQIVLHPCHDDFGGIGAGFGFPVQYKMEASCDVADNKTWAELFAVDSDTINPKLSPVSIDAKGKRFRFLRLTALNLFHRVDSYMFAIAELRVLDNTGTNLARGATVTALDSIEAPERWAKQNLVDGKWPKHEDARASEQLATIQADRDQLAALIETPERIARRDKIQASIEATQKQLNQLPKGKLVYAAATKFDDQSNFKATGGKPRPIHLLHRGNVDQPGQMLSPGLLPTEPGDSWRMPAESPEGVRRAELASWLTDRNNPLVWRSIVNRVWQHHFGDGLVATPNDFGRMGAQPTHPELLDWLASEFRDGDQSLKQLHRLIVTSSLYRQSSDFDEANANIDSGNQYLWRMNRRRLSAEEIRDSVLAVSGALDTKMGGPGFYLFELEKTEHSPHFEYHKFDPADPVSHRRSIYRFIARSQPNPYMITLDCADSSQSTPKRIETLTSLQALSLLNNGFNLEMARRFADRLATECKDLDAQLERAWKLVSGRLPTSEESLSLQKYANEHGLKNLCRMLFNLSEFVYLD